MNAAMAKQSVTHPIVHLAIDVQSRYLRSLSKQRQNEFPKAVRHFADILRQHGIPTIWVALLDRFQFHPRRAAWSPSGAEKRREKQLQKFDLAGAKAYQDEDVFIKRANNAFEQLLTDRLNQYRTKTLIITGMNTRFCVAATVFGAAKEHFRSLVVTDLLADMGAHDLLDADPAWHRKTIESALRTTLEKKIDLPRKRAVLLSRIEFCTMQDILEAHRRSPALAKKVAAALCKPKIRFN
jgi:nicotinamidase-related amidase